MHNNGILQAPAGRRCYFWGVPVTLFELTTALTVERPPRWQNHKRYALHLAGRELTLPAGTWLLELATGGDNVLYRLADGTVVSLAQPLLERMVKLVDHPEALRAMTSYRSLEQAALEDWGLQVEHIDSSAPFRLIKCPLCWGTEFASVDFAQVWCNTCNAAFTVRHTAGDPGFVVDCTWEHYSSRHAHYLLPRMADLCLTLVLKNGGDPLNLMHNEHCWRDDCTPEQVALTGPDSALRPGLHACRVGTLYGWSLNGRVPTHDNDNRHDSTTILWPDGREESWPETAFVRASYLSHDERRGLEQVMWELEKLVGDNSADYRQGLLEMVNGLLARPVAPPHIAYQTPFPDAGLLRKGEKYLLHRWLLRNDERYRLVYAYPVWLVVKAAGDDVDGWRVVRDNLCPRCGYSVLAEHLAGNDDVLGTSGGHRSHRWCRELWEEIGWVPPSSM